MKKLKLIFMLAAGMFVTTSCKDDDDDNIVNLIPDADRTFVMSAADGGMFEVMAGQLAVTKGDSTGMTGSTGSGATTGSMNMDSVTIKEFGQMMITDHTKANMELKTIADMKNVTIPTTLTSEKQMKLDSLSAASGETFDMMYTKMMVASHLETINLFQTEATSGGDAELKAWASGKLPILQMHLEMAQMMQDSIK